MIVRFLHLPDGTPVELDTETATLRAPTAHLRESGGVMPVGLPRRLHTAWMLSLPMALSDLATATWPRGEAITLAQARRMVDAADPRELDTILAGFDADVGGDLDAGGLAALIEAGLSDLRDLEAPR
ncbi:hypothetical protein [Lysobacter sp. CA199]|uniref:hypothetical protein n=1 Tax=Lysobacter sp. CA199 TaxID=3455608 RepID=UPI003F8D6CB0